MAHAIQSLLNKSDWMTEGHIRQTLLKVEPKQVASSLHISYSPSGFPSVNLTLLQPGGGTSSWPPTRAGCASGATSAVLWHCTGILRAGLRNTCMEGVLPDWRKNVKDLLVTHKVSS